MCGMDIGKLLKTKQVGKEFLDKVVNQIVSETMLNHYIGAVISPFDLTFGSFPSTHSTSMLFYGSPRNFDKHCK